MSRISCAVLTAVVLALAIGACGDDDTGSDGAAVATTDGANSVPDDTTTSTMTTTTVPDAAAEDPPAEAGGEDEGLGDPLVLVADLTGDAEVPGPGAAAARGRIEIESDIDGDLCIDMVATGLGGDVTDSHIHEGAAGATGGIVIPIGPPTSTDGDTDTWSDVCVGVDGVLVDRLAADPSAFYANIHTTDFRDGAVRAQLEPASIFDLTLS